MVLNSAQMWPTWKNLKRYRSCVLSSYSLIVYIKSILSFEICYWCYLVCVIHYTSLYKKVCFNIKLSYPVRESIRILHSKNYQKKICKVMSKKRCLKKMTDNFCFENWVQALWNFTGQSKDNSDFFSLTDSHGHVDFSEVSALLYAIDGALLVVNCVPCE